MNSLSEIFGTQIPKCIAQKTIDSFHVSLIMRSLKYKLYVIFVLGGIRTAI